MQDAKDRLSVPASDSASILVQWMSALDANNAGFVHGGVIMRLCDEVAGIAAVRHSGLRVVTAAMDRMIFVSPIHIGELVSCRAQVNAAWNTSMEVGVKVEAENPLTREVRHASTAYLTMVAVDDTGHPIAVPGIIASSSEELRRQSEAEIRRNNRLIEREQLTEHRRRNH